MSKYSFLLETKTEEFFELLPNIRMKKYGGSLLQGGGSSITEAELLSEYTEETLSMITSGSSVESTNARMVTAFVRSRGQGLVDGEWQDLGDWDIEDTKALPRRSISKVVEFISAEQEAEVKEAAEGAKKSQKRNTPQSLNG